MTDIRRRMSDKHEGFLANVLRGRRSRGSGNQWRDQMDGRMDRHDHTVAFAWDGKSTLGQSMSVTVPMWEKAVDQAGLERPLIPLRFYHDPRLNTFTDLAVIKLADLLELIDAVERAEAS